MNSDLSQVHLSDPSPSGRPARDKQLVVVLSAQFTPKHLKVLQDGGFDVIVVPTIHETGAEHLSALRLGSARVMTWKQATDPNILFQIGTVIVDSGFPRSADGTEPVLATKFIPELRRRGCNALIMTASCLPSSDVLSARENDAALNAGAQGIVRWDGQLVPTLALLLNVQGFLRPNPTNTLTT